MFAMQQTALGGLFWVHTELLSASLAPLRRNRPGQVNHQLPKTQSTVALSRRFQIPLKNAVVQSTFYFISLQQKTCEASTNPESE